MAKQIMFSKNIFATPVSVKSGTRGWLGKSTAGESIRASVRASGVAFMAIALLAACQTTGTPAPIKIPTQGPVVDNTELPDLPEIKETQNDVEPDTPEGTPPTQQAVTRDGLTPPHMKGRDIKRLALILPFSARSDRLREEAFSMMQAAEMAVFNRDNPDTLLIALDTQGTEAGAKAAVQTASQSGVDVILGPILSGSVKAASREARRVKIPMIAFSTDQAVAGNGTYLLSFPPEAEVNRIVDYARSLGITRFAYIGPEGEYGRRVLAEYSKDIKQTGAQLTAKETYDGDDITVMDAPARRLAKKFAEAEEASNGLGPMAFEAIMLPEGGTALRSLAPPLLYYEDGMSEVQFLGTGLWHREETVREPALSGGLFAGPDQEARRVFEVDFDRTYGQEPSRLASLAFDAVNFGVIVADGDPRGRRARIEDSRGFFGADGLVRFNTDGTPDRGLAVYQIRNGRFEIVDPAPRTTLGPG